jgi:cytochrome c oxidase subunit 2
LAFAALLLLAAAPAAADNERGAELFDNCTQCHGAQGHGDHLALAPAIAGLEQWYVEAQLNYFRDGARGNHPQDIPGLRMRPMSRTLFGAEDVTAVAAYVASLPVVKPAPVLEGGDAQKGQALYAACAQCHGAAGEGNQALNAPRLRDTSDWYLQSALERFKAGIRGSNPKNPNGIVMRGMSMMLADDQAIKDVVAYITTLGGAQEAAK